MSHGYGFLTESTIIPKKSKQIKMNDNSGQVLLQSIIQKQKEKLKNKTKPIIEGKDKNIRKNKGIQERIKRDEQQNEKVKLTEKNYYRCLEKKAQVYNKAENKKTNIDTLLVDFQAKQQPNKQEQQEFQKARELFYKGEITNIENQQRTLHQAVQTENASTAMMRQRLAWAKEMLNQMNGVETEQGKPKVIQSFDQKLSKEEKQAFDKIISEQEREKIQMQAIRRRKFQKQQQKIRKLRKLNIIKDIEEAAHIQRQQHNKEQQNEDFQIKNK